MHDDYVLLSNYNEQTHEVQAAILRYSFSSETRRIYNSLDISTQDKQKAEIVIRELEKFAKGLINETLERHQYDSRQQEEGESFENYIAELKVLITNCNFCNTCVSGLLRDRIVSGIRKDELRKELLAEKRLTLDMTIDKCRSAEVEEWGWNHCH